MSIHRYEPQQFHNAFGGRDAVISISPGDSLATTTLDAHGFDGGMKQRADRPNPLSGPFRIRGAVPGDTLAVRIEKALPNRSEGWSSDTIDPSLLDPSFVRSIHDKGYVQWRIDPDRRTITLTGRDFMTPEGESIDEPGREPGGLHAEDQAGKTAGRPRRGGRTGDHEAGGADALVLPLEPMLGCIGVSPRYGQVLSSMTAAEHGGNMDWRGCREGVTVYLPVFEEGGLLSVGDGHASQSDGEIGGTGVEISMDVQLRVDLLKGREISWPRAEDDHQLYTIGNARPFLQALQHATTEMFIWLTEGFFLDRVHASILMNQSARYEVANVFDPAYTAVCSLPKAIVAVSASRGW
jgi:amidase